MSGDVDSRKARRAQRVKRAAETVDQLINLDLTNRGAIRFLYEAAYKRFHGPLCYSAAQQILESVAKGSKALFLTGFPEFPWIDRGTPETDGPVGAAVLARSLLKALGVIPVFVIERHFAGAIEAAIRGIGLLPLPSGSVDYSMLRPGDPLCVVEVVDSEIDAERWIAERQPSLVVAIERPGKNSKNVYHGMTGRTVSHCLKNLEDLFTVAGSKGILTLAIGDGGNEIGMGGLRDVVFEHITAGKECGCGCGGGIAAQSEATCVMTAVLANFGATAVSAVLALLSGQREALPSVELELRSLEACAAAGAVDGQHNECVMSVDGLAAPGYAGILHMIADIVERGLREG